MFRSYVKSSEDMSWFSIRKNWMMIFIDSILLERAAAKLIWVHDLILLIPCLWSRVCLNIFHQLLSESTWMGATCYGDATVARYTLKGKDTDFNPYGCLDVGCWVGILTDSAAHIQYNILCVKVSKKQLICEQSQWWCSCPPHVFLFLYLMVFSFSCKSVSSPSFHFVPHQYKAQRSCNLCPPLY